MSGETERTEATLLGTTLATNTTGAISALDVRDAIYSLFRRVDGARAFPLPSLADASVSAPTSGVVVYYSTTQVALVFKDSADVVHVITHT